MDHCSQFLHWSHSVAVVLKSVPILILLTLTISLRYRYHYDSLWGSWATEKLTLPKILQSVEGPGFQSQQFGSRNLTLATDWLLPKWRVDYLNIDKDENGNSSDLWSKCSNSFVIYILTIIVETYTNLTVILVLTNNTKKLLKCCPWIIFILENMEYILWYLDSGIEWPFLVWLKLIPVYTCCPDMIIITLAPPFTF